MLFILIKIFYILINGVIGIYDFSFYRIPNLLLGTLLVLYGFYAPLYMGIENITNSLIVFAIMLVVGFGLYMFKFIGAGDAKYLAVVSLWIGMQGILNFILIFSLVGGLLGVAYLLFANHVILLSDWVWLQIQKIEGSCPCFRYLWIASGTGPERQQRASINSRMIPYGIAIAAGAIILMLYTPQPL